jgi:serine/threonine protein kinase
MKEILVAVDIMHSKLVLHRDLKPDNILLTKNNSIKIADFGLAKSVSFLNRRKSLEIASLWYRAPEIMFGYDEYLLGVDMWSVGCVFAEFYACQPIFKSKIERDTATKIFSIFGTPTETYFNFY